MNTFNFGATHIQLTQAVDPVRVRREVVHGRETWVREFRRGATAIRPEAEGAFIMAVHLAGFEYRRLAKSRGLDYFPTPDCDE